MAVGSKSFLFYSERPGGIICFACRQFTCRLTHDCALSVNVVTPSVLWQKRRKLTAEMLQQLPTLTVKANEPEKLANFIVTCDPCMCFQTIREIWSVVISAVKASISQNKNFEQKQIIHAKVIMNHRKLIN